MTDYATAAAKAHQKALAAQADMNQRVQERDNAIKAALDHGISAVDLGKALGLSRQRIYVMARKGKE